LSYDPVQRHLAIEKLVVRNSPEGREKKYYRVRPARWYGGIVTADCVGCGLLCKFCWVSDQVMNKLILLNRKQKWVRISEDENTGKKGKIIFIDVKASIRIYLHRLVDRRYAYATPNPERDATSLLFPYVI